MIVSYRLSVVCSWFVISMVMSVSVLRIYMMSVMLLMGSMVVLCGGWNVGGSDMFSVSMYSSVVVMVGLLMSVRV